MSAMHANIHVTERAPARERAAASKVRDHRDARPQPVERDHRDDRGRIVAQREDRDHRDRPVIVRSPVVVTRPVYGGWAPASSYSYDPQPISLISATSLASGQLSIDTANELTGATALQIESAGAGSTYVTRVVLYGADGDYQVVNVNAMLSASNPTLQIPLASGANVVRVAIDGHSDWGGAIALQAV
jgi:hypothetical protein